MHRLRIPSWARTGAWPYVVAVTASALAFGLTTLIWPLIKPTVSPLFILAVMFSAWFGGFGPGLLATGLASVLSAYFLMEPSYSVLIGGDDLARLVVFAAVAVAVGSLTSARRRAEARLAALVREKVALASQKELLLREVHHRVKNNLQVISSLLSLQADGSADERIRAAFRESQDRVRTMALVHEHLHQTEGLTDVDFKQYLTRLLAQLAQSYGISDRILVRTELDDVMLGLPAAIPCALLVNELVSNAFEHAFAPGQSGVVRVSLRAGDGRVRLTVQDNGRGLPGAAGEGSSSLGLRLVQAFVEQLKGSLQVTRERGTTFHIEFRSTP